jgi:hypothetical protein
MREAGLEREAGGLTDEQDTREGGGGGGGADKESELAERIATGESETGENKQVKRKQEAGEER